MQTLASLSLSSQKVSPDRSLRLVQLLSRCRNFLTVFVLIAITSVVKPTLHPDPLFEGSPSDGVDPNSDSAIYFPVASLGVHHIIVVGHTRCGGVAACMPEGQDEPGKERAFNPLKSDCSTKDAVEERSFGGLSSSMRKWLQPVRDLVNALPPKTTVEQAIIENVRLQVRTVASSTVVQSCWSGTGRGCLESVNGWLYDVDSGELRDLSYRITKETPFGDYQVPRADLPQLA